jgi:hypothetical protein
MVLDIQANGDWLWPENWNDMIPMRIHASSIIFQHDKEDQVCWKDGISPNDYSTATVWNLIRYRLLEVAWANVVWFSQCIPRHAFLVWLVMRGKLQTQDKILGWYRRKNMNMMCCLLCYYNIDSHSHLFFECSYSAKV